MKLVEIVVGQDTSTKTVALLQALTNKIDKIGVVVENCNGFVGNRMLKPYRAETAVLLVEGLSSTESVDRALRQPTK
jgi:3-hydroxyacyl-CoA dehydrogenase